MKNRLLLALLCWLQLLSLGARAQNLSVQETFEGLGTDFGYTSNAFNLSNIEYFERRAFTAVTGGTGYTGTTQGLNNRQGSYTWTGEGVRGTAQTNIRSAGYVVLNPITTSASYKNFVITVAMAAPRGGTFTGAGAYSAYATDRIRIQYSFNGGAWTTAAMLMGNNARGAGNGNVFQELTTLSDSIGVAAGTTTLTSGTVLDQTYRDITATLPSSAIGANLRVRVVLDIKLVEVAFDNIRVTGVPDNTARPTLTGIETTAASYTEGGSPVQLTNALQVKYSDNSTTSITSATVSVSGAVSGQDALNYSTVNGITGNTPVLSGGVLTLTLTGTATQADYQTAIRSITYSNSNTTTLAGSTRTINFTVFNGSTSSGAASRSLTITPVLNAPAALNYTENFDVDGEGTRYFGNPFVSTSTQTGFFRATTSPATFNGGAIGQGAFTGWSGGYWFGEGNDNASNPGAPTSTLQLAPVNASGRANLKFTIALGATGSWIAYFNAANPGDAFELYYRLNGGTPVKFAAFYGNNGTARQDADLDITTLATGTALTTTLQDFTFDLPAAAAVGNLDFLLVQAARAQSEIAFDNIRITGTAPPTVTTTAPTTITTSSAVLGGNVRADGGGTLTERGVVYVVGAGTPTTSDTKALIATSGIVVGTAFSGTVSGLMASTPYSARAYAINSAGTSYGSVVSFTTTAALNVSGVTTNVSCFGGSNGTINLTPNGGTAPYSFNWGGGITTEDRTGLTAGTYSVTITDATSTSITRSFTVTQPSGVAVTPASQTNIACFGGATGAASINLPTGGTPGYTYDWTPGTPTGDGTASVSGLSAGTYTVTVTDANGCTASRSFTISQPASALNGTAVITNVSCFGGSNGTINLTPNGGTAPYSFNWGGGITTEDRTGLTAGTYSVTITDMNGCTGMVSLTISQPPAISLSSGSQTNVTTAGGSNGTASVTPAGGTPGYTYDWAPGTPPGEGTASVSGLSAGTYTVTVTDANSCTASRTYTITQPATVTPAPVVVAPTNGSLLNTTTPAYAGTAVAGSTVTVYVDGTSVNMTSANASGNWFINQPTALAQGSHTVYAMAQASGQTVSGNSNTNTFMVDSVAPSVAIGSSAGASGSTTPTSLIPFTVTFSEPVTGFVAGDVTVTNGTISGFSGTGASYSFNVTPNTAGTATTVSVPASVAQDAAGNTNTAAGSPYIITYLATPTIAGFAADPASVCVGSPVSFTATVGNLTGSDAYTLTNGSSVRTGTLASSAFQETLTSSGTGEQSFTLTISSSGQRAMATTPVRVNALPVATLTNDGPLSCTMISATLTASGGGTYQFSNGASQLNGGNTASVTTAGPYSVTVTGANGCTATALTTVTGDQTLPTAGLTNGGPLSCTKTSVTLTASGGSSYTFTASGGTVLTGSGNTRSVSSPGTYSVTVANASGCISTTTTTVISNTAVVTVNNPATNTVAINIPFSQRFTASGGATPYSFSLASGSLPSGLSLSGGGILSGIPTQSGSFPITVQATDASGCSGVGATYTLVVNTATPTITGFSVTPTVVCVGSPITFTATIGNITGDYGWLLSTGGPPIGSPGPTTVTAFSVVQTASGSGVQTFTLTVTSGGQVARATTTLTVSSLPTASLVASGSLSCAQTSVTLTAGAGEGLSYRFSAGATPVNGGNTATVITAGPYSVTVTSANGCTATATTTVVGDQSPPTASLSNNGPLSAGMSSVTLTAAPGGTAYAFSAGASQVGGSSGNTATVTTPGSYSVTITGTNGCTATAATSVTTTATPTSSQTVCRNSRVVLTTARPASRYEWYKNGQTAANKLTDIASIQVGTTTASLTLMSVQTSASYYVKEIQATGSFAWSGPFSLTVDTRCTARIGQDEPRLALSVQVSPNPVEGGQLRAVVTGAAQQPLSVWLTDMRGLRVAQQHWPLAQAGQVVNWDISQQPAGIYLLRAETDTGQVTIRVLQH